LIYGRRPTPSAPRHTEDWVRLVHVYPALTGQSPLASLPFPMSGRQSRDRRGEARGRLANAVTDGVARYSSAVVQGHTMVHSWTIWLKWRQVVIRPPQCWLDSATKVIFQMTSWRQHAITWHVCTLLLPGRTLPPAAVAQTTISKMTQGLL